MSSTLGNKKVMASNIRRHLDSLGMNVKDFATEMNFKYSTVLDWVNAKTYPRIDKIEMMANYFNINKSDLVEEFNTSTTPTEAPDGLKIRLMENYTTLKPKGRRELVRASDDLVSKQTHIDISEPLVAYQVVERLSAGLGQGVYDDYDTVYHTEDLPHDLASWIAGDSMEPTYLNGDVALIKDTSGTLDYQGAICAVVWDGKTYIKKVYQEEAGLRLVSINPKYADLFAAYDEEPRIVGKIVGSFKALER